MIDIIQARKIALEEILRYERQIGERLLINEKETVEFDRGWVFFYETERFLDTGDDLARLAGNGPLFVDRIGRLFELPSSMSWVDAVSAIGD